LEHNGFVRIKKTRGPHLKYKKYAEGGKCVSTTYVSHAPEIQPTVIKSIVKQSKKPESDFY